LQRVDGIANPIFSPNFLAQFSRFPADYRTANACVDGFAQARGI
jgi:hypothetical protein